MKLYFFTPGLEVGVQNIAGFVYNAVPVGKMSKIPTVVFWTFTYGILDKDT